MTCMLVAVSTLWSLTPPFRIEARHQSCYLALRPSDRWHPWEKSRASESYPPSAWTGICWRTTSFDSGTWRQLQGRCACPCLLGSRSRSDPIFVSVRETLPRLAKPRRGLRRGPSLSEPKEVMCLGLGRPLGGCLCTDAARRNSTEYRTSSGRVIRR